MGQHPARSTFTQYLTKPDKYSISAFGDANIRIFKGFSFNVFGEVSRTRDQLYLPLGEATTEEILVRQRQLETGYSYYIHFGIWYSVRIDLQQRGQPALRWRRRQSHIFRLAGRSGLKVFCRTMSVRETHNSVAIIRFAHGKVSALDAEFCTAVEAEIAAIAGSDLTALVLTGTGSAFSAGVDLYAVLKGSDEYVGRFLPALDAFFERL